MKNNLRKFLIMASLALVACCVSYQRASADTIAYTTSGTETDLGNYGLVGFEFTVNQNINLTALGFTGLSLSGADTPHVTLFNATASLAAPTLIYDTGDILGSVANNGQGTGTGAPSFVSVGTPISLVVGQTYLITAPSYWTATFDSSGISTSSVFGSTSFLTTSSAGDGGGLFNGWPNSGYNFANFTSDPSGFIATTPNFEYTLSSTPAPEPSTYLMLGAGLLALVVLRKRMAGQTL